MKLLWTSLSSHLWAFSNLDQITTKWTSHVNQRDLERRSWLCRAAVGKGRRGWLNTTGRVVSSWGDCRSKIQESAKPWAGSLQAFSSLGQPRRSLAGSWIASVSASIFPRHSLVCLCLQLPFSPSYKGPGPVGARRTLKTSFQLDHTHRDPTSKESHREK